MNRREFISAASCLAAPAAKGRPNVLFLMTDEQHHRSLSMTGNPYIKTPNMDRIAREGALFTNATCVTPYCSPSRATMITGVYPHRHGIVQNVGGRSKQTPLAPDAFPNTEMTLHRQGYATAFRGKWHLGELGDFPCYEQFDYASKTRRGYEEFLEERLPAAKFAADKDPGRYHGRPVEKIPAIRKAWGPFQEATSGLGYIATIGRTVIPPELLPETQITNEVVGLIEKNRNRNFMITASWSPPHDLWVIPEPYYSMVDRKRVKLRGQQEHGGVGRARAEQTARRPCGGGGRQRVRRHLSRHGEVHRRPDRTRAQDAGRFGAGGQYAGCVHQRPRRHGGRARLHRQEHFQLLRRPGAHTAEHSVPRADQAGDGGAEPGEPDRLHADASGLHGNAGAGERSRAIHAAADRRPQDRSGAITRSASAARARA